MFKKIELILTIIFSIIFIIIQNSINNILFINNIAPNFYIILIILCLYLFGFSYGLIAAVLSGITCDMVSNYYVGIFLLSYLLIAAIFNNIRKIYLHNKYNNIFLFLIIFISNIVFLFIMNIINSVIFKRLIIIKNFNNYIVPSAVYSALVGLFIFAIINVFYKRRISKLTNKDDEQTDKISKN